MKKTLVLILVIMMFNVSLAAGKGIFSRLSSSWDSFLNMAVDATDGLLPDKTADIIMMFVNGEDTESWVESASTKAAAWLNENGMAVSSEDLMSFITSNRTKLVVWYTSCGIDARSKIDLLLNPAGHTPAELKKALKEVIASMEDSGINVKELKKIMKG